MPTIKLQNGNVLLKAGKPSCTCCGAGFCCYYPAAGFDSENPNQWDALPGTLAEEPNCEDPIWTKDGEAWTYLDASNRPNRIIWRTGKWVHQIEIESVWTDQNEADCLTSVLGDPLICGWPPCVELSGPDGLEIKLSGGGCFWETCEERPQDPLWKLRFNGTTFELVKLVGETATTYESDAGEGGFPLPHGEYGEGTYEITLLPIGTDCCAPDPEPDCCMYPADTPAGDLPEAITLNGTSLSKSGTSYGDTTDGLIQESGVWARYVDGVRSTQTCLITGDGNYTPDDDVVEDQFAAQYTIISGWFSGTLTRSALCCWDGTTTTTDETMTFPTRLVYVPSEFGPYWAIAYFAPNATLPPCPSIIGFLGAAFKFDLTSPVGDYSDGWVVE